MIGDNDLVIESFSLGNQVIELHAGDITNQKTDVIVSSDDNFLSAGGGVSRAILYASQIDLTAYRENETPAQLGSVVITEAGRLSAKYIFHAIVIDLNSWTWPDYNVIKDATKNCLLEADRLGCSSIAIPALGTGAGGVTSESAAKGMVETLFEYIGMCKKVKRINLVLFREDLRFDFFKNLIEQKIKNDYEQKLQELKKDKENLINNLTIKSPFIDLPSPIAIQRRIISSCTTYHSKFTASIDCTETILRYLGAIILAEQVRLSPSGLPDLLQLFSHPVSFKKWGDIVNDGLKHLLQEEMSNLSKQIKNFYWGKNKSLIDKIISIRNMVHGHGATYTEDAYQHHYESVISDLDKLLIQLDFIKAFPLRAVVDVNIKESSYEYEMMNLMGDNTIFTHETLETPTLRLQKRVPYIIALDGTFTLKLSPFITFTTCPFCQTEETFFIEYHDNKLIHYHTFRSGHRIEVPSENVINP